MEDNGYTCPQTHREQAQLCALFSSLARELHEAGAPSHRLEATLEAVARSLGAQVSVFATPTSLMLQVNGEALMLRVTPQDADLARLVAVDSIGAALSQGKLPLSEAISALTADKRPPYPRPVLLGALAVGSVCAGVLFGGGVMESLLAGALALMVGLASGRMAGNPHHKRVVPLATATTVALLAGLAASLTPLTPERATLAALIVFVPGLSLTTALAELAAGHLSAGTARLAGAGIVLLQLGLGAALGLALAGTLFPPVLGPLPLSPSWLDWPSVLLAGLSFALLFQARPKDIPWIIVASVLAIRGTAWAIELLGPRVGPGLGAFAVVLFSNAQARARDLPASVTLLPGLLLLVPGSIGFHSVQAFSQDQTLAGLSAMVEMLIVAAALVGGLLTANAVLPPRREL